MSTPSFDERPHATALIAAIKAQLGAWNAYELGEVPGVDDNAGSIPDIFAVVQVERMFLPTMQSSRKASRAGWRASIKAVGRTVSEARWAQNKVALALDSARLTIGSRSTTPIQHESTDSPEPDGDHFSALSRWTYAT